MVIQTRVFSRLVIPRRGELATTVAAVIADVTTDVNNFLAPLGDKCVGVHYAMSVVDGKGHALYSCTVTYLE